ncbi:MAG TPA: hypothetical protein VHV82_13150 [Sporichthyaceae bacterium]|jgi:hypothetical protein|nr:hypothetical protein [Sporichthyaceae bacterium]
MHHPCPQQRAVAGRQPRLDVLGADLRRARGCGGSDLLGPVRLDVARGVGPRLHVPQIGLQPELLALAVGLGEEIHV